MGPSGSGKETPRKLIYELFTAANALHLVGPSRIASWEGLVDHLIRRGCVTLAMIDEVQGQIEGFRKKDGSNPLENLKMVKGQAFNPSTIESVTRSSGVKTLCFPHVSLLATGTPSTMAEKLGASEIGDGFLGRSIYFEINRYGPENPNCTVTPPPESLVSWVQFWQGLDGPGNLADLGQNPFIKVTIDEDALARYLEHSRNIRNKLNPDLEKNQASAAIWARTAEHTNRLALIAACADDASKTPVIKLKVLRNHGRIRMGQAH
jgi:hypothetical protein